jgi:hypothetical protein
MADEPSGFELIREAQAAVQQLGGAFPEAFKVVLSIDQGLIEIARVRPPKFKVVKGTQKEAASRYVARARTHKSRFCKPHADVRFAPKATELLRRREMSRWAQKATSKG